MPLWLARAQAAEVSCPSESSLQARVDDRTTALGLPAVRVCLRPAGVTCDAPWSDSFASEVELLVFAWRRGDGEPLLGGDPFPRPRPEECDEAERAVVERLVTALDARPGPAPPPRLRLDLSGGVGGRVGAPGPEGDVTFAMAAGLQRGSLGISARLRVARGATRRVDLPNGSSRPASIATDEIEIGLRLSRLVAGGRGAIVGELGGARPSWQGGGALEGLDGEAIPLSLPVLPYAAVEGRVLPARVPVYFATALLGSVPWQLDDPDRGSLYRSPVGSVGVEVGLRWP